MSTTSELPLSLAGSEWPFRGPRTCSSARDSADALPRVLVLGAGGFIGSHVAKLMASAPTSSDGIFVTRLSTRQPRFPTCGQWTCFNLAESSSRSLGHLLERLAPQVVVNCTGATEGSAADLRELNVGVVHKLVSALASAAPAHLVHLGSAAEYGAPKDWRPVKETAWTRPSNEVAATKLAATELICDAVERGRISATVLRVFEPIGAGAPPSSFVSRAVARIREALAGGRQMVTLDGLESAGDFIDVRDVARAVLAASELYPSPGQPVVFNVGRGIPVAHRWLAERLAEIAGFEGELVEATRGPTGPVACQFADMTAVQKALAWTPRYLLSEALGQAWSGSGGLQPTDLHPSRAQGHLRLTTVPLAPEAS